MNREDFENMVSQYLKPNSYKVDGDKIRSVGVPIGDTYLWEEGRFYAVNNKQSWFLIYAEEGKHFYYRVGGRNAEGWELVTVKGQGSTHRRYIERRYPITNLCSGHGWYRGGYNAYLLPSHFTSSFINWTEDPFTLK